MKIFLKSDGEQINNLSPFTKTRPISELRIGIFTIREKWEMLLASTAEIVTPLVCAALATQCLATRSCVVP